MWGFGLGGFVGLRGVNCFWFVQGRYNICLCERSELGVIYRLWVALCSLDFA